MVRKPNREHTKKGLWSPHEDDKLRNYMADQAAGTCWTSIATSAGLQRSGKSCRLRWINYLLPGLKRGAFTLEEDEIILALHRALGNKWSQIAHHLPGRTDNAVKNYWHSHLKKRFTLSPKIINGDQTEQGDSVQGSQRDKIDKFIMYQLQMEKSKCDCGSSLPKVVFTEWLCNLEEQCMRMKSCADSGEADWIVNSSVDSLDVLISDNKCEQQQNYSDSNTGVCVDDHDHDKVLWEQLDALLDYFRFPAAEQKFISMYEY